MTAPATPAREPVDLAPIKAKLAEGSAAPLPAAFDSPWIVLHRRDVDAMVDEIERLRIRSAQHAATGAFFRTIANAFARELDAETGRVATRAAAHAPQRA